MNLHRIKLIVILLLLALYNYLFWNEMLGINLPLFTGLLTLLIALSRPDALKNKMWHFTAAGVLITGVAVVLNNLAIAKFTHILFYLMLVAFSWWTELRSPLIALFNSVISFINEFVEWVRHGESILRKNRYGNYVLCFLKILFFPAVIITIYILLYSGSSAAFAGYFTSIGEWLVSLKNWLISIVSIPHILFLAFGLLIIGVALRSIPVNRAMAYMKDGMETLFRNKITQAQNGQIIYRKPKPVMGLKRENHAAIFLLVAVNLLLLLFNWTDIRNNWVNFTVPEVFSLKKFVHEATWYLVISILLSIGILLYYFRKNLNFYSRNKTVKLFAYAWIVQNTILCISVLLRNMHYISYHGLAYKRIGVLVFLALVAIGLLTLYFKINKVKSRSWLLRVNSMTLAISLVLMSVINWDMIIVRYNLQHKNISEIDINFYLRLSPQVYPVLYENLDIIKKQIAAHTSKPTRWSAIQSYPLFKSMLDERAVKFMNSYDAVSWPSFNIPYRQAYYRLQSLPKPLTENLNFK